MLWLKLIHVSEWGPYGISFLTNYRQCKEFLGFLNTTQNLKGEA